MIEAALERKANLSPKQKRHARFERVVCLAASAPTVCSGVRISEMVKEEVEHTLMGLKVQNAAQNTSPVLSERRIIFGTSRA
jgi:hypothetical protein